MSHEVQLFTDPHTKQRVVLAYDYAALQASHDELVKVLNMAKPYIRGGQAAESILYDIDDALANAAQLDTTK